MMDVDPQWEYNAPQFVDFTRLENSKDDAENYFDVEHTDVQAMDVSYVNQDDTLTCPPNTTGGVQNCEGPVNVCGSLSEWRKKSSKSCVPANKQNLAKLAANRRKNRQTGTAAKTREESAEAPTKRPCIKGIKQNASTRSAMQNVGKTGQKTTTSTVLKDNVQTVNNVLPKCDPKPWLSRSDNYCSSPKVLPSRAASRSASLQLRRRSKSLVVGVAGQLSSSLDVTRISVSSAQQEDSGIQTRSMTSRRQPLVAKTPNVLKHRAVSTGRIKSTVDLELEKVAELRKKADEQRQLAAESYQSALAAPKSKGYVSQPTTKVEAFKFTTDSRVKNSSTQAHGSVVLGGEVDFTALLRQNNEPLKPAPSRCTKPKPFNLELEKKRKRDHPDADAHPLGYKFQTLAEKVLKFSTKTPERFRVKPHSNDMSDNSGAVNVTRPALTLAKTPRLMTRNRARPTKVLSQAELEEQEIEEMKKYQFRANPLNRKVLENGVIGVPHVPVRNPTSVEPFALSTGVPHNSSTMSHLEVEQVPAFRAKPAPKAILDGVVGLKPARRVLPTVAHSPAFQPRKSSRLAAKENKPDDSPEKIVFAHPLPEFSEPFMPQLPRRITEPQPFSFEDRTREMFKKRDEKIQKVLEEEERARQFRAQPMPDLTIVDVPEKKALKPTKPEPFDFAVDVRAEEKMRKLEEKMESEEQERLEAANFKARPAVVLHQLPFEPQKAERIPIADIEPFQFHSDERAKRRAEFDQWRNEQERLAEQQRLEREQQRMEEEQQEIQRLRAEAVHHALPIRQHRGIPAKQEMPLTVPQSPCFSERLKTRGANP